jgi:hypothetical protein
MPKQKLHRVERAALRNQAACKRPSTTVTDIADPEACRAVQIGGIALEAVGRQMIDRLAIEVDGAFNA